VSDLGRGEQQSCSLDRAQHETAFIITTSMHNKIRDIVSRHARLTVPMTELADTSDLYSAGLTSLATVGLMLALEDAFEIEFPDSMLSRKTFRSVASLAAAVDELGAKA
jgi:acyl carrier protein